MYMTKLHPGSGSVAFVVAATFTAALAMIGCGKTGVTMNSTQAIASSGGGGEGGTRGSGGMIGQGGALSAGGVRSLGGATAAAGTTGHGGVVGSGGAAGGATGTVVSPRTPVAHRPEAQSCQGAYAPAEPYDPQYGECKKHADCTDGTNGKCVNGIGAAWQRYFCVYDLCATDGDCDPGKVCYCESGSARCLSLGNCRTDADCGGGATGYCSPSSGWDCGGYHTIDSYYCHTPKDTCIENTDCTGRDYCSYDVLDGRWKCTSPNMTCVIG
jgi:hypothetical protein